MLLSLVAGKIFADSPITSTTFYTSYSELPIVQKVHSSGTIDDSIAAYLLNDSITIDVKAAIINAFSGNAAGKNNAPILMQHIIKKYKLGKGFDINLLSADDIFCLGYLDIMENISQTEKSIKILTIAINKKPKSFTIRMILALVEAQNDMNSYPCDVYKTCTDIKKNANLNNDMRQSAIDKIFDFINTFKKFCKE